MLRNEIFDALQLFCCNHFCLTTGILIFIMVIPFGLVASRDYSGKGLCYVWKVLIWSELVIFVFWLLGLDNVFIELLRAEMEQAVLIQ